MDGNYQWVGWLLSSVILGIIAWVNMIRPAWRKFRMRKPFSMYFRSPQHPEAGPEQTTITLPRNSSEQIQVNREMCLTHLEYSLKAVFMPAESGRPEIHSVDNAFISKGLIRKSSPDTNERHYITDKGAYHIKSEEMRIEGEAYSTGYVVQTHAPGEYELQIETTTESGQGQSKNKLKVVVE